MINEDKRGFRAGTNYKLRSSIHTMAEHLKATGYSTAGFTSVFFMDPSHSGLAQGFDWFEFPEGQGQIRAGEVNKRVLQWFLRRQKSDEELNNPFFIWIHYFDPHVLYDPPEEFRHLYFEGDPENPDCRDFQRLPTYHRLRDEYRGITDLKYIENLYKGEITYIDKKVGEIVDIITDHELMSKTLIILTADHGENLGEHSLFYNHAGLYQTTVNIPLILYCPAKLPRGKIIDSIVNTLDIFPTVLELIGTVVPDFLRGRSLASMMQGEEDTIHRFVFSQDHKHNCCVLDTQWKLILPREKGFVKGFTHTYKELYNLESDPEEKNNLVYVQKEKVDEFTDIVEKWLQENRPTIQSDHKNISSVDVEKLQMLGYVY
jgi:arylsulfatase A-like enzyme